MNNSQTCERNEYFLGNRLVGGALDSASGVYKLHALLNANGIQIGAGQHVFMMHTDLFVAHCFELLHKSNNEQTICVAQIETFFAVSNR
jgi:hypothetical protein